METEELYTLLSVWQQTNYELALSWEMLNLSNYYNGEEQKFSDMLIVYDTFSTQYRKWVNA